MTTPVTYRFATQKDIPAMMNLIHELAQYLGKEDEVDSTPELLNKWLFEKKAAEALLAECAGEGIVGWAIFYQTFSTWTGQGGMYLEDLCVESSHRGLGVGRGLVTQLAAICAQREWVRLDWLCLDW